jgi:hypothetical protein
VLHSLVPGSACSTPPEKRRRKHDAWRREISLTSLRSSLSQVALSSLFVPWSGRCTRPQPGRGAGGDVRNFLTSFEPATQSHRDLRLDCTAMRAEVVTLVAGSKADLKTGAHVFIPDGKTKAMAHGRRRSSWSVDTGFPHPCRYARIPPPCPSRGRLLLYRFECSVAVGRTHPSDGGIAGCPAIGRIRNCDCSPVRRT